MSKHDTLASLVVIRGWSMSFKQPNPDKTLVLAMLSDEMNETLTHETTLLLIINNVKMQFD